jgi:hypothetical protein
LPLSEIDVAAVVDLIALIASVALARRAIDRGRARGIARHASAASANRRRNSGGATRNDAGARALAARDPSSAVRAVGHTHRDDVSALAL